MDISLGLLKNPKVRDWGFVNHFRGRAFRFKEKLEEARREYEICLSKAGNEFYRISAKSEIASVLLKMSAREGQDKSKLYELATEYCIDLLNCDQPRIRLGALSILGSIKVNLGEKNEGLEILLDALDIAKKEGFPELVSGINFHLSQIFESLNEFEKQIKYLEESQSIQKYMKEKLNVYDVEAEYFISSGLGKAYSRLKRHQESVPYWEKCVEIDRTINVDHRLAHSLNHLGKNQCLLKIFDHAHNNLRESLGIIRQHEIKDDGAERHTLAWLTVTSWYLEYYEQAFEFYLEHNSMSRLEKKHPYFFSFMDECSLTKDVDFYEFHENQAFMLLLPQKYKIQEVMQVAVTSIIKRRPDLEQEALSLELLTFERPAARGFGPSKASPNQKCPCGSGKKYKSCCGKRRK